MSQLPAIDPTICLSNILRGLIPHPHCEVLRAWLRGGGYPPNIAIPSDCEHRYALYCNDMFATMHMCRVTATLRGLSFSHGDQGWHEAFSWDEVLTPALP